MAGFDNLDVEVDFLIEVNDFTTRLPGWAEGVVTHGGELGLAALLGLLVVAAWLRVRRSSGAIAAVAGLGWALSAWAVAYLLNAPIRNFVARPRPFEDHEEVTPLVEGKTDYSFVSDHSMLGMAIAVGLFLVHRKLGVVAFFVALLQGFARVMMGLHYPTDVIGGFALGTAVVLLLAPLALAVLTPLVSACSRTRWLGWLAQPPPAESTGQADQDRHTDGGDGPGGAGGPGGPRPEPGAHPSRPHSGVPA